MSKIFEQSLGQRQNLAASIFEAAQSNERLANAYLLSGRNEADKWLLARQLAAYLNCLARTPGRQGSCLTHGQSDSAGASSAICQNCLWLKNDQHPQAWLILDGGASKTGKIAVEKARLIAEELSKTSQYLRLVVIPDASEQTFHRPAANALLKTIEEPGPACLFLLFAVSAEEVLPTILSRCQIVPVINAHHSLPEPDSAEKSFPGQSETILDFTPSSLSDALNWSAKLIELTAGGGDPQLMIDSVVSSEVGRLKAEAAEDPIISLYLSRLLQIAEIAKEQIEHFVQPRFVLESFAVSWLELGQKRRRES